jgi:plastocyanin
MKFNRGAILLVLLLASTIFSIKFSLFDLKVVGDYYEPLQIRDVYADELGNDANSTIVSGAAGDPSNDNSGNQCDPADPACGGGGGDQCDPADPACGGGGGDQCDPADPACGGGGGDQCDPADPACGGGGGDQCGPADPACGGGGGDQCDPADPACGGGGGDQCDPADPACGGGGGDQCDPADPACGGGPLPPMEICDDGVDNDGDGNIDIADSDCIGGPLPPALPGGGAIPPDNNPSPVGDRNTGGNQLRGGMQSVLENDDEPRSIFGAALQTNLLPIQAEAKLPTENNCNDGQDNDHNGLKDSEDPGCGVTEVSQVEFENLPVSISTKISESSSENHIPIKNVVTSASPLATTLNNKTSVISILGAGKHDIRTISSFHYGYSPEKITIEKGSKVMWINQDPTDTHGINLIDRLSGKTLFSYPVIRFENFAYYEFQEPGQFTYVDPMLPSMSGVITVVK